MQNKKKPPANVLKLIAEAIARRKAAQQRQANKPRRPWGLPPKGGSSE